MTEEELEKEAEEYCTHQKLLEDVRDNICKAFEDGAEFGYNKANKWHSVKDGDLPKEEGTYFVVWQNDNGYKEIFIMKYEEDDEEEFHWLDDDYEVFDEYVIAWKEIELPKEIKENDHARSNRK